MFFYNAKNKLAIMTSTPNPVPKIVGHAVPASGKLGASVEGTSATYVGVVVGGVVVVAHRQSVSDKHCEFRQLPAVDPLGI